MKKLIIIGTVLVASVLGMSTITITSATGSGDISCCKGGVFIEKQGYFLPNS